ncbi:MAG: polynucleotide kinase-phosphatase [Pseudomonadota bacterium]
MRLTLPQLSLVVLVGPSGAGKSSFAAAHFSPWEVLSSDHYRGVVSDDPESLDASADAFDALRYLAAKRLARGLLTVIDATSVRPEDRQLWVRLAREHHVLPVAIVLDLPARLCQERNALRPHRDFGPHVVRTQSSALRRSLRGLGKEGFRYVHVLRSPEEVAAVEIVRERGWTDRRDQRGPFDIIGDVHGCLDELLALLDELGWRVVCAGEGLERRWSGAHEGGRHLVFLGDLVDRGPAAHEVLRLAMDLVEQGVATCLPGNHEVKLLKALQGRNVRLAHGLDLTLAQLAGEPEAFRVRVAAFLDRLISHFVLDDGRLVVAHAGMRAELAGRASGRVREFALYGETTGETDEYGLPVRYPWAKEYRGQAAVVYGHTPVPQPAWLNDTLCIDTGCVFGGALTALRWPERQVLSVPARRVYCEPARPLAPPAPEPGDDLLDLGDLIGGEPIVTRFGQTVGLRPERVAPALEVLSRFTEDPHWLIHLPPTMSPAETSSRPDLLEHPDEAFAYFRAHGVREVVCEAKHMGSRAVVILGRSPAVIAARFGVPGAEERGETGVVLSRRGRRFFTDPELERAFLARLGAAMDAAGLWEALGSDWVVIDGELMPWSAKAQSLLEAQYAPVGQAGRTALGAAVAVLERAAVRQPEAGPLLARFRERREDCARYTAAYRRYCWPVAGLDDHRFAPFHVLASEGRVHDDATHAWHLETLARLCAADPALLLATPWRAVELGDEASVAAAVAWWAEYTASGGEGMVVKPATFLAWHDGQLVQPALKCRGREYLRIIYGPEYARPEHLGRLRRRGTGRKRSLAARELILGLEALHRFVERRPLREVHACVAGILALEAEPVDPRL